ncbi:MAG TPA: peptidase C14 [Cyanobacteria bacterium UBA8553]|nr:peptidase C14 [Cyanobacteria bacterium UBA8553]HAJ61445.1 peptidase C14 [Cyanobacteria bacterium UBA8543]
MANWALVVGINKYDRLRSLEYAESDAASMQSFFQNEAGFEEIFYFSDNSPEFYALDGSPQSTRPTYANLWSFLYDFFEYPQLKPGDNFWFFFSGHGIRHQDRDYLMPCDANPRAVEATAISISYVTERLRRCGADNVVLLLDACRNEGDKAGLGIGLEKHQGVITISSCSPREKSYEIEEIGQGAFTYALLESLRIQGEGNCATVERLYQRLRDRVAQINLYHKKPRQTPYAIVEPASKYHLILLPRQATLHDIATLREDAAEAELEGEFELAEQLWTRVLAVSPADPKALRALKRIWSQPRPTVTTPSPAVTNKSGAKSQANALPLQVFEFDEVTVNANGQVINRRRSQAECFIEDLGNGVTLEMVAIPGGTFQMGSPITEAKHHDSESPQHQVTVKPFFMGKYPVTQAQWGAVAKLPQVKQSIDLDPSHFKGDDLPVEKVSWYDAAEFCSRLSKKMGREYRLPSEAEWEYACRAGTTTPFHFGETITADLANYDGSSTYGFGSRGRYRKETTSVGSFQVANAFGLYDMHGNVWEWCADHWHDNYEGAPLDGSAWINKTNDNHYRLLRGGSWYVISGLCRCAYRNYVVPDSDSYNAFGFRVVCGAARTL